MGEDFYKIIDENNHLVADSMTLENALIMIKGYIEEYYNEPEIKLTIIKYIT